MVITRVARAPALALALTLLALGVSACNGQDGDTTEAVEASELPANLCDAVPADFVEQWGLSEVEHDTAGDAEGVVATCTMDGTYEAGPVSLDLMISTFPGDSERAAVDAAGASTDESCGRLEATGAGDFVDGDHGCRALERDDAPEVRTADAVAVSQAIPLAGVVTAEMTHTGPGWQIVQPSLTGLVGHLSTSDLDELVEPAS